MDHHPPDHPVMKYTTGTEVASRPQSRPLRNLQRLTSMPDALGLLKALRRRWAPALALRLASSGGRRTCDLLSDLRKPSIRPAPRCKSRRSRSGSCLSFVTTQPNSTTYQSTQLALLKNRFVLKHALVKKRSSNFRRSGRLRSNGATMSSGSRVNFGGFVGGSEILGVSLEWLREPRMWP